MSTLYGAFTFGSYPELSSIKDRLYESASESEKVKVRNTGMALGLPDQKGVHADVVDPDRHSEFFFDPDVPSLAVRIGEGAIPYVEESDGPHSGSEFVDLFTEIYNHLPERPDAAYLMGNDQSGGLVDGDAHYYQPVTAESLESAEYHDAAWVMIFPPAMVEQYGPETFHDLPIRRIDELEDGSIVTVTQGDPTRAAEWRALATALGTPAADDRPF